MSEQPGATQGSGSLFAVFRRSLVLHFVTCACRALDGDEYAGWRPCPASLCERRAHTLAHRLATSPRDYRYGGFRAWLRWIVTGTAADWEDE